MAAELIEGDLELLLEAEDRLNREAHDEEVEEMRVARELGEYDCGQDDSENDENCTDCHWDDCPKKPQPVPIQAVTEPKKRRQRRRKPKAKENKLKEDKPRFAAPNYQAYLNYSQLRRPSLEANGHSSRDCNAIIFEEWHSMEVDQKIRFYNKTID